MFSLLPLASLAWSEIITPLSTPVEEAPTMTSDCGRDWRRLGVTQIVGCKEVTAWPLIATVIVDLPTLTPVKVAVYVPSPLSIVLLKAPMVLPLARPNTTVWPPVISLMPFASSACNLTVIVPPTVA